MNIRMKASERAQSALRCPVFAAGRTGLLVAYGDVLGIASAILDLLDDTEKARRMGVEGRRMAIERFDERLVCETVKAEYARLLREKGLRQPQRISLAIPHPRNET